jgi:hypothetical protein
MFNVTISPARPNPFLAFSLLLAAEVCDETETSPTFDTHSKRLKQKSKLPMESRSCRLAQSLTSSIPQFKTIFKPQ